MKRRKQFGFPVLVILLLLPMLLCVTALAVTQESYSATFNGRAGSFQTRGKKVDMAERAYSSATLKNGILKGHGVTFMCRNEAGQQATGMTTKYNLGDDAYVYYLPKSEYTQDQRYNGTKYLVISSNGGVEGCGGPWWP